MTFNERARNQHEEHFEASVENGIFNLIVGSVNDLPVSIMSKARSLGVSIDGGAELTPRTAITGVPSAASALSLAKGATGAVTSFNGQDGDIVLKGGTNTLVETEGNTITITAIPIVSQGKQEVTHALYGTANQVLVNGYSGSANPQWDYVTLTLPQNIHAGASPTFAGMTLSSLSTGSTATNVVVSNSGVLQTRAVSSLGFTTSGEPILTFSAGGSSLTDNRVLTAGNGISLSNAGTDNGAFTITNSGVLSNVAGTGISISSATGNVTITNNGVLSVAGTTNQVNVTGPTELVALELVNTNQQTQLDNIEIELVALELVNTNQQTQLDDHEARLDIIEPELVALELVNTNQQTQLDDHESRLDVIEPELVALELVNTNQQTQLDNHESRLDIIEPEMMRFNLSMLICRTRST